MIKNKIGIKLLLFTLICSLHCYCQQADTKVVNIYDGYLQRLCKLLKQKKDPSISDKTVQSYYYEAFSFFRIITGYHFKERTAFNFYLKRANKRLLPQDIVYLNDWKNLHINKINYQAMCDSIRAEGFFNCQGDSIKFVLPIDF